MPDLHVVNDEKTAAITVSEDQLRFVREILDLTPEQQATVRSLLALGTARTEALVELAGMMVDDEIAREPREPRRLAVVDGTLEWTIACRPRALAQVRGENQPICRWRRDRDGFTCQTCAIWVGEETGRGAFIARTLDESSRTD